MASPSSQADLTDSDRRCSHYQRMPTGYSLLYISILYKLFKLYKFCVHLTSSKVEKENLLRKAPIEAVRHYIFCEKRHLTVAVAFYLPSKEAYMSLSQHLINVVSLGVAGLLLEALSSEAFCEDRDCMRLVGRDYACSQTVQW